jgi:hypothetical protein
MVSATVTNSTITITYNEAVTCAPATSGALFTYYWTSAVSGTTGGPPNCSTVGNVLTLTGNGAAFTLPSGTATIKYTAPSPNDATSVFATSNPTSFAATQTIPVPANATVPAMVSAHENITGGVTTLVITYNENVSCDAIGADGDFAYFYDGLAPGGTVTGCTYAGKVLTLAGTFTTPTVSPSIVYTAPTTPTMGNAVFATGTTTDFAATQTLSGAMWTAPAMVSAMVTPTVTPTTINVTYSDPFTVCPTTAGASQAVFVYSNGGTPAYPTTCAGTGTLTLGTFMTTATGTTGATLVLPGASDTLTYTAPVATNTITNSVHDTVDFPQFAAMQTFALTATPVPAMVTALVTPGTSIAITYNSPVSCALAASSDFVYNYQTTVSGGTPVTCTTSGSVLTLTGAFNAPMGSARIVYNEGGGPSTADSVYATGNPLVFAKTPDTLAGSPAPIS